FSRGRKAGGGCNHGRGGIARVGSDGGTNQVLAAVLSSGGWIRGGDPVLGEHLGGAQTDQVSQEGMDGPLQELRLDPPVWESKSTSRQRALQLDAPAGDCGGLVCRVLQSVWLDDSCSHRRV